jgi:hypothetical protein
MNYKSNQMQGRRTTKQGAGAGAGGVLRKVTFSKLGQKVTLQGSCFVNTEH